MTFLKNFNKPKHLFKSIVQRNRCHANHVGLTPVGKHSGICNFIKNLFTIPIHINGELTATFFFFIGGDDLERIRLNRLK